MDESLLPKLKRCTREVVAIASKPGGLLDKGEFTMSVARGLITKEMGLKEGELDGKEWKRVVKEEVTAALVCHERSEAVWPKVARRQLGGWR
jgi:hypothetical protein